LPGGTKGNHDKLFFRVTGLWVAIREWEYPVQNRSAKALGIDDQYKMFGKWMLIVDTVTVRKLIL
jgi:hypothetical protein